MYTWRTDDDFYGLIRVRDDGGEEFAPTLHDANLIAVLEQGIATYELMFRSKAAVYDVPWEVLPSMALQESRFQKRALRIERNKDGSPRYSPDGRPLTGVGMFQITDPSIKGSLPDELLYDVGVNTNLAIRHIANLWQRKECRDAQGKPDPVRVFAAYNAGSIYKPRPGFENKWGMHCWYGHIDVEVAAWNYTILRELADIHQAALNAVAIQPDLRWTLDARGVEIPSDPDANA